MDIMSFIPSRRQAILERFQQVETLGLGAVHDELKVANPVGIIYDALFQQERYFLIKLRWYPSAFSMKGLERISLDVVDIPGRSTCLIISS